jgi:hypothetical protein
MLPRNVWIPHFPNSFDINNYQRALSFKKVANLGKKTAKIEPTNLCFSRSTIKYEKEALELPCHQ